MLTLLMLLDSEQDRVRFEILYNEYRKPMYRVALSILKEPVAAEDSVHDSFVKIIRNFGKISSLNRQELEGYIVIIVKNTSLDHLRKKKKYVEFFDLPSTQEADFGDNPTIDAIRSMSEIYRQVLELRFVLGYDNHQIAKILGISVAAVEQRISRGRRQLETLLKMEGIFNE